MGKPTELVDIKKWGNQPSWLILKKPIKKPNKTSLIF